MYTGPAYKEFGYKEHPATKSRFLYIKIIDCNIKIFRYNEHLLTTSSFFYIFLLVVSGTHCKCFVRWKLSIRVLLQAEVGIVCQKEMEKLKKEKATEEARNPTRINLKVTAKIIHE